MQNWIEEITYNYDDLIPKKIALITICALYNKIKENEIEKYFTYKDIEITIREVSLSQLLPNHIANTENVLGSLLRFYLEHPARQPNKYQLTGYAEKIIQAFIYKLNNPHKRLKLQDTLAACETLSSENIKTNNDLTRWFQYEFKNKIEEPVNSHLDNINDEILDAITELNNILKNDKLSTL